MCASPCDRFQELVQSTEVEELLTEAELARLRAELGQEGEPPITTDVIEQVCILGGMWEGLRDHVCMHPPASWPWLDFPVEVWGVQYMTLIRRVLCG